MEEKRKIGDLIADLISSKGACSNVDVVDKRTKELLRKEIREIVEEINKRFEALESKDDKSKV